MRAGDYIVLRNHTRLPKYFFLLGWLKAIPYVRGARYHEINTI